MLIYNAYVRNIAERKEKKYKIRLEEIRGDKIEVLKSFLKDFRKALVVFNTIDDAINFYRSIEGKKVLIHSGFSNEDREKKGKEVEEMDEGIVVGTQAIEAGLDFSSDLIISELCPANSLVQRFGRFLRRDEKEGKAIVWYEGEISYKYKVYDGELVKRTLNYLSSNNDVDLHIDYKNFLDRVYSTPEVDYNLKRDIVSVITNLSSPSKSAIDLLIKMDGSLVRDGDILTAVSSNGVEVPVNFSYVSKNCVKAFNGKEERVCPKYEREAVIYSLEGFKFLVKSPYTEKGLIYNGSL
jgi:CRISPR-associated endonuclease/helicase Cas3